MNALDRLEPWSTSGVGSLPHTDPGIAVDHVLAAYELPFCPQLPRLDGDMIREWLGADPARCGWSPQRDRQRPAAWDELLRQLRAAPPRHGLVKLQVTGPATLACALEREVGALPTRAETLGLAAEIAGWLAANAAGQVAALAELGLVSVLVVDEPAIGLFGLDGVEWVWDPLRSVAPAWGLHLCGQVPWRLIERVEPDLLSFDLAATPVDRDASTALGRLVSNGAWIAWGALAVHRQEHGLHAARRLDAAIAAVPEAAPQSLITPSCGSGRMSVSREHEIATALYDAAAHMRAKTRQGLAPTGT